MRHTGCVTEQRAEDPTGRSPDSSVDELARARGVKPIQSVEDLAAYKLDVWESDEDLDAFLADVRASRNADLA